MRRSAALAALAVAALAFVSVAAGTVNALDLLGSSARAPSPSPSPTRAAACALEGMVELRRDGKPTSPKGKVVVYLEGRAPPEFRGRPRVYEIRRRGLEFIPALLVVRKGDEVEFVNDDTEAHSPFSNSPPIPFEFPKSKLGITGIKKFNTPGPVRISCNVHHWMRADVLVLENPFFSTADANGQWQIDGLREGDHTLVVWEPNGATSKVSVKGCTGPTKVVLPPLEEGPSAGASTGSARTGGRSP